MKKTKKKVARKKDTDNRHTKKKHEWSEDDYCRIGYFYARIGWALADLGYDPSKEGVMLTGDALRLIALGLDDLVKKAKK